MTWTMDGGFIVRFPSAHAPDAIPLRLLSFSRLGVSRPGVAGTPISVFFEANDWRVNAVRGENFHHNAAQDTYPPEGVRKIRGRRARSPTSKGIYPVRDPLRRRRVRRETEKEGGTGSLGGCAQVSSANAFSPLSEMLSVADNGVPTIGEGESGRGWAVSTLDLVRELSNDRLLCSLKG